MRIRLSLIIYLLLAGNFWIFQPDFAAKSQGPSPQPQTLTAVPVPGEVARVILLPSALERLSTLILPIGLGPPGPSGYRLIALEYCSATNDTTGNAIGLAIPASWTPTETAVLTSHDCLLPLPELATNADARLRGSATSGHAVAVRVRLTWAPSALTFQVIEANDGSSAVAAVVSDQSFFSVRTDAISVTDSSVLHGIIGFRPNHVTLRLFESASATAQSPVEVSGGDSSSDALVAVTFDYLSRMLASQTRNVSLNNAGNPVSVQVAFSRIAAGSGSGTVAISGSITVPTFPAAPFAVRIKPKDGDLVYENVTLQTPVKPCGAIRDFQARVECQSANTVIRQVAQTQSERLQTQAVNQPFRPVSPSQLLRLNLRGQQYLVQFETQSAGADSSWLVLRIHPLVTKDR